MRKIKCTLSTIEKAIRELENYQKLLKGKASEMTSKIADECEQYASFGFAKATYDGYNDAYVSISADNPLKYYVTASGESVAFIEFGTGTRYAYPHPIDPHSVGLSDRGEFGYHLGLMQKGWYYWGVPGTNGEIIQEGKHKGQIKTLGNPANRCLYDAKMEAGAKVADIAKEVFGK